MSNRNEQKKQSQYRGVTWDIRRQRWVTQIYIKAKNLKQWVGAFTDERQAALAYDRARIKNGFTDKLNILKPKNK